MDKMYSEHCDTEDIFYNKPYIFAFKNQAFDLQTGETYDIKKRIILHKILVMTMLNQLHNN